MFLILFFFVLESDSFYFVRPEDLELEKAIEASLCGCEEGQWVFWVLGFWVSFLGLGLV